MTLTSSQSHPFTALLRTVDLTKATLTEVNLSNVVLFCDAGVAFSNQVPSFIS